MKQKVSAAVICLGLAVLVMGFGGKYSDVIKVNQEYIKLMKAYVSDLAEADSGGKAAKALNKLADGMEKLVPEMKAVSKKYSELDGAKNLPEEIKKSQEEMDAVSRQFGDAFMKLAPYMADPEVQKAQMRLSTVMSGLGQE